MSNALRHVVLRANMVLFESGLVTETFGNVSGVDREHGLFYIKASGVPYSELNTQHMVPVSLERGTPLETTYRPSSDTPTHLELYRAFPNCGGVAHSHSPYATAFCQAGIPLPCMGTTHADYFKDDVPITRQLNAREVRSDYERNTGLAIVETFKTARISPEDIPGVLVASHGPFTWGADPLVAVEHARVLEYLAHVYSVSHSLNPNAAKPAPFLAEKHFSRKHGKDRYYGQPEGT